MDCGPSLGVLTLNALSAANEVFIPLQPHFLALHGMGKLLETTALVAKRINPSLKVTGIVLSLYESSTRLAQEVVAGLAGVPGQEPRHATPRGPRRASSARASAATSSWRSAPASAQSIFGYAPNCNGAEDYAALAREVLGETPTVLSARVELDERGQASVMSVERQEQPTTLPRERRDRRACRRCRSRIAAKSGEVAMSKISIASPQEIVPIDRGRMREVVRAVLDGEGVADAEISLAFVDNPTIHALNKRYLQHDEPTDVLSFPLSEPNAKRLAGELVIGVEVAQAQAAERGHDVQAELALYVIHGLLHLCGYDDHDDAGAAAMRERERHYLRQLGLPDIAASPTLRRFADADGEVASGRSGSCRPRKRTALVLRTTDWSETSRIATLWTREFGKVRVLAKGGRRLKSNFENALDLLTRLQYRLPPQIIRQSRPVDGGAGRAAVPAAAARIWPPCTPPTTSRSCWPTGRRNTTRTPCCSTRRLGTLRSSGVAGGRRSRRRSGPCVVRFELVLLREWAIARPWSGVPPAAGRSTNAGRPSAAAAGGWFVRLCGRPAATAGRCRRPPGELLRPLQTAGTRPGAGRGTPAPVREVRAGAGPVRHLPAGPPAALVALPGELRP